MKILWWRILIAGVFLEMLYVVYVFGLMGASSAAYDLAGLSVVFALMMIGGLWIGRNAVSLPVLQGSLVGVTGIVFYVILSVLFGADSSGSELAAAEQDPGGLLILNHSLKVLGGAVGGFIGGTWLNKGSRTTI